MPFGWRYLNYYAGLFPLYHAEDLLPCLLPWSYGFRFALRIYAALKSLLETLTRSSLRDKLSYLGFH